jgi:hypothetical protein
MPEGSRLSDKIGNLPAAANFIPTLLKTGSIGQGNFSLLLPSLSVPAYKRLSDNLTLSRISNSWIWSQAEFERPLLSKMTFRVVLRQNLSLAIPGFVRMSTCAIW